MRFKWCDRIVVVLVIFNSDVRGYGLGKKGGSVELGGGTPLE